MPRRPQEWVEAGLALALVAWLWIEIGRALARGVCP